MNAMPELKPGEWTKDLILAMSMAREAGEIVRSKYGHVDRLTKTHAATTNEAVTEADRESQRSIVAAIRKHCPGDGIVGEESDSGESITFDTTDIAGRNWVIDPIDGTNNFIAGLGAFAVCIGLLDKGKPVVGVVLDVTRDEMYAAATGFGSWLIEDAMGGDEFRDANSSGLPTPQTPGVRRLKVSQESMSDCSLLMLTSNLLDKSEQCPSWAVRWIGQTKWKVRMLGSAAMEAVQVAAGVAMGAVTVNGKIWDAVAPAAIVLEAGGVVSTLAGEPVFPFDLNGYIGAKVPFLAAGPTAHSQLLEEIRSHG